MTGIVVFLIKLLSNSSKTIRDLFERNHVLEPEMDQAHQNWQVLSVGHYVLKQDTDKLCKLCFLKELADLEACLNLWIDGFNKPHIKDEEVRRIQSPTKTNQPTVLRKAAWMSMLYVILPSGLSPGGWFRCTRWSSLRWLNLFWGKVWEGVW